jgi:hypothetical protein
MYNASDDEREDQPVGLYVPSDDEGGDQPVRSTRISLTATRELVYMD